MIFGSSRRLSALPVVALLIATGTITTFPAHAAPPRCFGQAATIIGTRADEVLRGTKRTDVIVGRGGSDQIVAGGGDDLVCAGRGFDFVTGGPGSDRIKGQSKPDVIEGGTGDDELIANKGAFHDFVPGPGDDEVVGGPGTLGSDIVAYLESASPIVADLAVGSVTGQGSDRLSAIESVIGSPHDDTIRGDTGSNLIIGGPGNDDLQSGGNPASLEDPEASEQGDFVAGDTDFRMEGFGPTGDDIITGGEGFTVAFHFQSPNPITADLQDGTVTGEGDDTLVNIQGISDTTHGDTVTGSNRDEGFEMTSGNDNLDGAGGQDTLVLFGTTGVDVDLEAGSATGEDIGSDSVAGIENVWASPGPDRLSGNAEGNAFYGFEGRDTLAGRAGDDLLDAGAGSDSADGGADNDTCIGAEQVTACESTARTAAVRGLRLDALARLRRVLRLIH